MTGYLGSKGAAGLWQGIVSMMPEHDLFVEAYLGSGVVTARKPPAARTVVIETDLSVLQGFEAPYDVERVHGCALDWLSTHELPGRALVYADPPYLHSVRTCARSRYRYEVDDAHHEKLLEVLNGLRCAVMISGYRSEMYDRRLAAWTRTDFQVMTRGGVRTECVWSNVQVEAGGVFWASKAGKNFTDRQRIKRKAARWAKRYRKMPAGERLAVLSALLAVESEG